MTNSSGASLGHGHPLRVQVGGVGQNPVQDVPATGIILPLPGTSERFRYRTQPTLPQAVQLPSHPLDESRQQAAPSVAYPGHPLATHLVGPYPSQRTFSPNIPANANIDPFSVQKKKRGRPPGSRNKPKDTPKPKKEPGKLGRPFGSGDKKPRKPYTWKTPYKNSAYHRKAVFAGIGPKDPPGSNPATSATRLASFPTAPDHTPSQESSSSGGDSHSPTMPYNNAAIAPSEEITGQCSLPLARVKKILHIDEDTHQVSNNASFVITIATEMFIRYLAEQALNVVKAEKKPRRNIQYKDLANAVARIDNLQFLEDVIPQTITWREYKAKKATKATTAPQPLQNGQTTLDGSRSLPQRSLEAIDSQAGPSGDARVSDRIVDDQVTEAQGPESPIGNSNGLVFEHYEPNGTSKRDGSGDVEMT